MYWDDLILKPRDVLRFTRTIHTLAGNTYEKGDELLLIAPTKDAPFGFSSPICNWRAICKYNQDWAVDAAVWSTIWQMVETGTLERLPRPEIRNWRENWKVLEELDRLWYDGPIMEADIGSDNGAEPMFEIRLAVEMVDSEGWVAIRSSEKMLASWLEALRRHKGT